MYKKFSARTTPSPNSYPKENLLEQNPPHQRPPHPLGPSLPELLRQCWGPKPKPLLRSD